MRTTRRSSIFLLALILAAGLPSAAGASGLPPRTERVTQADEVDPKQEPTAAAQAAPDRVIVKWKAPGKAAAVAGSLLRSWLDNPRALRAFNIGMALLLVASLYPILVDTGLF